MTHPNSQIHTIVMRRIRTIHVVRAAAGSVGVSLILLAGSLYVIGREVWVARVFENMPNIGHISAFTTFFTTAFLTTDAIVQVLTLLSLFALLWLMRSIGKILFIRPTQFA
jgi:hypothetical protein